MRNVQAKSSDEDNHALVSQLTQGFLSEFALFPFYNLSRSLDEPVDKVIIEDNLNFMIAPAMDSPIAFFKDSLLENSGNAAFERFSSTFNQHGKIRDMLLQDDGETVLTGHDDGKILRWKVGVDQPLDTIYTFKPDDTTPKKPIINIRKMAISGTTLLVGVDSLIYELDLKKRKPIRFLIGFNRPIKFLVANPKKPGEFAVVKENSSKILLCHNDTSVIRTTYHAGLSTVTSLAFSPDGRKMIAAYEEGDAAKMWDLKRPYVLTEFKGHRALISSIAFSKDGRKIITGSWDQTAILWTYKGEIIKRLIGHERRIRSVAYTKNNFAVTCSEEGNIKLWYLSPLAEQERIFSDSIRALAVSSKHDTIAFSLYDDKGRFYLWNWQQNTLDTVWQPLHSGDIKGDIVALAYTEDGRDIVAASENTLTTLIDRSGNNEHLDLRGGGKDQIPYTSSISAVDVNKDYILIADRRNHQVLLRDRSDLSKFKTLVHSYAVHDAKFSPDGKSVLTGCEDGFGYLWDITLDSLIPRKLLGHESKVVSVDFSPDGLCLLTGSYDNTARFYQLKDNEVGDLYTPYVLEGISPQFRGHTSDVNTVAFTHEIKDGVYRFFTGSADKSGKYCEFRDGAIHELPSVIRHLDETTVAGFLPGDSLVVTGGFDETMKVWNVNDVNGLIDDRVLRQ